MSILQQDNDVREICSNLVGKPFEINFRVCTIFGILFYKIFALDCSGFMIIILCMIAVPRLSIKVTYNDLD